MAWSEIIRLLSRPKLSRRLTPYTPLPLPAELILMLIGHLNQTEISSAIQTCHAMRSLIEPYLYVHISIPSRQRRHMANLLRTLHTRPDLARNIITFDGSLYPSPHKPRLPRVTLVSLIKYWRQQRSNEKQERALSETIVTSIYHMVNIKSLTLRDFGWLGTPYQNLIRDAISLTVSLSSLTSLVIQGQDFPPSGRHENHSVQLALLLRSQPLLECLELRSSEWDLQDCMLQSDVPRLSHLVAGSREARFLVCGRPITSLFIRSITREPGPDGWKALAASSAPITFLALDDMYHPFLEAALHSVAMHFKDVQKLSIQGAAYQILPLLIGGFPSFPYLRTLRLKAWDLNMEGTESIEDQRLDAIMYIRHRCPQFQNLEMDQKWI